MARKHQKSFDIFSSFSNYLPGWKGLVILTLLLLAGACLGSLATLILGKFLTMEAIMDYQILIVYPLQFIPAMLYAAGKSHRNEGFDTTGVPLDDNRFAPVGGVWLAMMAVVGTIACALVTEPAIALLPAMPEYIKKMMEMLVGGPLWVALLSTAVFAPIFEEWLCRGMILRGMLQRYSPTAAIIISAAFFAIIHMNPWQAIPAFVLGCLFGLVYYKTGSLKLTMLMHCANNAFSVLLTRIPGAQGKEYIYELFSDKICYGFVYAACLALVIYFATRLIKTEFTK